MLEIHMGGESKGVETESRKGRPPLKGVLASQLPQLAPGTYSHEGNWQPYISELSSLQGKAAGVFIHQLLSVAAVPSK